MLIIPSLLFLLFDHFIRLKLSFQETVDDETDNLDVESADACRPQFSNIKKVVGTLDKELAASGFTRKDQESIEQVLICTSYGKEFWNI